MPRYTALPPIGANKMSVHNSVFDEHGRFSPERAWDLLTLYEQRAIGIDALTLGRARALLHSVGFEESWPQGDTMLVEWAAENVIPLLESQLAEDATRHAAITGSNEKIDTSFTSVGRSCRICGCTELHACEVGCGWRNGESDICTACQPRGGRLPDTADA